jgi:hypothetical protein
VWHEACKRLPSLKPEKVVMADPPGHTAASRRIVVVRTAPWNVRGD